ncbi:NAD(P)H-dependent glycerol-3-phosphate dehydrogenase [Aneurinibacillus aneurinilyticus]|jgi:glycerol-3-phosphate dehydrogenase (NAD(P)+)|uniref:Glycerol-3-phosphate dehydrogenase [NAD(P)+] n=2 Tax=Aneurinibacillus aneurinilyticus TaxID=1391 RepID=A0A848CUA1_ANEAE|nr:NAD(P)H-dependent glycerol-3-phosphate dehydrogenase [Aneurinibacillus aneurinilyticus]ERI10109.1 glycerol-3-phosphate dehydrogenase [NAD(P)+ ] [Aneurinibacillus aneurinilyticus ATCC 12856]MCI1692986.1 NAD(P)H-dependent glycerol-3-phosphate dehydrogenase [Aneurinibacillus aneurinilyticus]MED0669880.1 NAD(P)H-dependent glycerol-3-phosphate dehydrogenase [Aneurinibacillus aneurinilyticus]MED0708049.1 NAD(P)H-dependent glycerol-3-phosphate dehydrogenase [Aneurinibacillus aneurinilyticus]MED072
MKRSVAVIGAGSWGTALATVLSENHDHVSLWARREELAREMNEKKENKRYLPGIKLSPNIMASASLEHVVRDKTLILLVVPSHAMRATIRNLAPYLHKEAILVHATKGLEIDSLKRMSEVIKEEVPEAFHKRIAVLSGPSHAEEVGLRAPTTVVVAAEVIEVAEEVQDAFITARFRVYTNPDVIGVEIGGALKNIIALGAGVSDGLKFGDNAKAALLTRGLAEISRLGIKLGASPLTFTGLAGVGDLVVTATSQHSRNWRAGNMLAEGLSPDEITVNMGMVVEGIKTTKAAYDLSRKLDIEMPITRELHALLFENKAPREAVSDLMGRVRRHETEELALEYFENR